MIKRDDPSKSPYITQEKDAVSGETYGLIKELSDSARITFKYFKLPEASELALTIRGQAIGNLSVIQAEETDKVTNTFIEFNSENWESITLDLKHVSEAFALDMTFEGKGKLDLKSFEIT